MRLQDWTVTAATIAQRNFSIEAHSRGAEQPGGGQLYAIGGGARWTGDVTVNPMLAADAFKFRAFLHSLRGKSGSFMLPVDPGAALDSVLTATAAAGDDELTAEKPAGYTPVVGGWIFVGTAGAGGQLFRIVAIADAGDDYTITVRPRARAAFAVDDAVRWRGVTAPFRLVGATPEVAIIRGGYSTPLQLDIEEAY